MAAAKPSGALADAIARDFGSLERWRAEFAAMGKAEGGGSGWVILAYSPRDKRLVNQWAADHTTTLAGGRPVLVLDMYEHAYHMDYGAAAARYVDIYMEAIRWDNAAKLYEQYQPGSLSLLLGRLDVAERIEQRKIVGDLECSADDERQAGKRGHQKRA